MCKYQTRLRRVSSDRSYVNILKYSDSLLVRPLLSHTKLTSQAQKIIAGNPPKSLENRHKPPRTNHSTHAIITSEKSKIHRLGRSLMKSERLQRDLHLSNSKQCLDSYGQLLTCSSRNFTAPIILFVYRWEWSILRQTREGRGGSERRKQSLCNAEYPSRDYLNGNSMDHKAAAGGEQQENDKGRHTLQLPLGYLLWYIN